MCQYHQFYCTTFVSSLNHHELCPQAHGTSIYWPCYPMSVAGIQGQESCARLQALALLRMTVVLLLAPVIDSVVNSQHLHMYRIRMVRMGMLTFITSYSSLIPSHSCF